MNRKSNRACHEPGCVGYAVKGSAFCAKHAAAHARVFRLWEYRKAAARLYRSGQWQAMRRQQLTTQPFCAECLKAGKYTLPVRMVGLVVRDTSKMKWWRVSAHHFDDGFSVRV